MKEKENIRLMKIIHDKAAQDQIEQQNMNIRYILDNYISRKKKKWKIRISQLDERNK
jgi:hypothetical protein